MITFRRSLSRLVSWKAGGGVIFSIIRKVDFQMRMASIWISSSINSGSSLSSVWISRIKSRSSFCPGSRVDRRKIFGEPDENGYSIVRKMTVGRHDTDSQGRPRRCPWYVEIQNGIGIPVHNANGGTYCQKDSCQCRQKVALFLNDRDMFALFGRAEAYIRAFELEYAFRQNRIGNFTSLYQLLKQEIQQIPEYLQDGERAA